MSCYFRHMRDVLEGAGIDVTPQNKKLVDQALHKIADVEYKNCSPTWKKLKSDFINDPSIKQELIARIKESMV